MPEISNTKQRLTIRIGRHTLSFSQPTEDDSDVVYEPYVVKSGVSMAANLREAFKTSELLMTPQKRVRVVIDADVLMVPVESFNEEQMETLYFHAFPKKEQLAVYYNVLPDLNCVAVFGMNKDLRLVIDDHFQDVNLVIAMSAVWRYLHQRSFTGNRNKLYGYFHEKRLEIFNFQQNRFKFCNAFDASRAHDSLYFLLYVWKQLQLEPEHDELHIVGEIPDQEWLVSELKRFLQNAYVINPEADFNHHPITEIKSMPYDLQTLFIKGR
jgi:hypothetical protein